MSEIADPIQLKAFGTVDTHKTDRGQIENKKKVVNSKEIRDKEIPGDIKKKRKLVHLTIAKKMHHSCELLGKV